VVFKPRPDWIWSRWLAERTEKLANALPSPARVTTVMVGKGQRKRRTSMTSEGMKHKDLPSASITTLWPSVRKRPMGHWPEVSEVVVQMTAEPRRLISGAGALSVSDLFPVESISRVAMMMANHNDPIALKALFEDDVVGKLLEITPPSAAGIIVVPLRVALDGVDGVVNLLPKLVTQVIRNFRVLCGYASRVFRRFRVDDQRLHRAIYRPQSFLNSSLETPSTSPESNSADRVATSSSSTQWWVSSRLPRSRTASSALSGFERLATDSLI